MRHSQDALIVTTWGFKFGVPSQRMKGKGIHYHRTVEFHFLTFSCFGLPPCSPRPRGTRLRRIW